jgi:hypothetical protein
MKQQLAIAVWILAVKIVPCFRIRIGSAYGAAACYSSQVLGCHNCFLCRIRIGSAYGKVASYSLGKSFKTDVNLGQQAC